MKKTIGCIIAVALLITSGFLNIGCQQINNNGSNSGKTSIYDEFANYPDGKVNGAGTLELKNNSAEELLAFTGSISGANYIATISGNSSVKVVLDESKFYTIVACSKAEFETKGELSAQISELTYYSKSMGYTVTLNAANLLGGAGTWILNNNSNYWAAVESVDGQRTFCVIQPKTLRVKVPVELNKAYDYKVVYKKELKYQDRVLAIADMTTQGENDTLYLDDTTTQFTTDLNGITGKKMSDDLAPSIMFINNSGKSVRVYAGGQVQLSPAGAITNSSSSDDYVLISGKSCMLTGFDAGTQANALAVRSVAWDGAINCTDTTTFEKGHVYRVTLGKDDEGNLTWAVVAEDASEYYEED